VRDAKRTKRMKNKKAISILTEQSEKLKKL